MSAPAAIVGHMRRRSPAKASPPPLDVLDAGCCLLGLDHMRRLGLPCPSDAEVLRFTGIDVDDPDDVEDAGLLFRHKALAYLIDGMMLNVPVAPDPM
jgi:hypothetical protein